MARPPLLAALAGALALVCGHAVLAYDKSQPVPPKAGASAASAPTSNPVAKPVDLNRASRSELKTLPGIGDAEASRIVASRPYKSKADLVTRNVLTIEVYDRLSKQVVVDHRKPAPKAKT